MGEPMNIESALDEMDVNDRKTAKEVVEKLLAEARLESVEEYKRSLDVPELEDFTKGTILEAQHQRQRWGDEHDTQKDPEEWFWLVGYLAGKGLHAQRAGNMEKFKHHLVTGAAVLANWHARTVAELRALAGSSGPPSRT
jgi:hypothetical protein